MIATIILPILLGLLGNAIIYTGIAFVNTQLFPDILSPVYAQMSFIQRLIIMSLVTAPVVNYLCALVYQKAGPSTGGMILISTLALVLISKALLLQGGGLNLRIIVSASVLIFAASWVVFELQRIMH